MKKILVAIAAGGLMSLGGLASAAEPVQLTDNQMDSVAAGQASWAFTRGSAEIGVVASGAETRSFERVTATSTIRVTSASAATIASGIDVHASAAAGSSF